MKKTAFYFVKTIIASSLLFNVAQADVLIGNDLNSANSTNSDIAAIYSANRGTNGGGDQSQQFGDALEGTANDDLLVGGLGIDILFGGAGDDIIIGGTEDFNPFNRDRAFGQEGDDTFIWTPGDGNDFFDGGSGVDVLVLSLIGESRNSAEETAGAPFFGVSPPGTPGTQNFDGIHQVSPGVPVVNFINSPGFCEIVERDAQNQAGLDELGVDHLIRFVLRGPRAAFNETIASTPPQPLDDGLRIAVHLKNVEYLACTSEAAGAGSDVRIFDLTQVPAVEVNASDLPARAAALIQNRAGTL